MSSKAGQRDETSRKIRANSDMGHSSAELIASEVVGRAEVGLNIQGQITSWHKVVRL